MKRVLWYSFAPAVIAVSMVLQSGDTSAPDEVAETAAIFPAPGSVAPDFALPVLKTAAPFVSTDTVRLSDLSGRYVYLDVFGTWCLECREKYPEMVEIAAELREIDAVVIGLLLEDSPETAAAFFEESGGQGYPFLVLDDATARTWGLSGAPMGFLISPEGRVERLCFGCSRGESRVATLPDAVRAGLTERWRASS